MTSPLKSMIIGTAGHIDHGKTALIRALTGVDTDRLPEEKRRGITIDLGFASLDDTSTDGMPLRISFVDVPGHAHFIRNMLAGTGGIDGVLLVIAADEGIKPQTEEHLAICGLLGVRYGITVVSKIDVVDSARLNQVIGNVEAFLHGTFLDAIHSQILPVSVKSGHGLSELHDALLEMAKNAGGIRRRDQLSRLPIDRAFVMKGFGTVVTGTLLSGTIRTGESVALEPGGHTARVRGIQTHGHAEEVASAGSRIALNLAGVELSEVCRGQTIVEPEGLSAASTIDAEVALLPGETALKHRARVHFHALTADTVASISMYGYVAAEGGTKRLMRLRLREPIVLTPGDRFVLRRLSPAATIGGGRILDVHPIAKLKKIKCLAWLESLRNANREEQLKLRIDRRGTQGLTLLELSRETGITKEALAGQLDILTRVGELVRFPEDLFLTKGAVEVAVGEVLQRLDLKTSQKGIKVSELRHQMGLRSEIIESLIERLSRERRLRRNSDTVYTWSTGLQEHTGTDPLQLKVEAIYEKAGLASPATEEVAAALGIEFEEIRRIMTNLLRNKTVVRMGIDPIYIHYHALQELRSRLGELRGLTIDVGRFKEMTGLSRKYAIPLLEYLDRERVTRKQGDQRLVL